MNKYNKYCLMKWWYNPVVSIIISDIDNCQNLGNCVLSKSKILTDSNIIYMDFCTELYIASNEYYTLNIDIKTEVVLNSQKIK